MGNERARGGEGRKSVAFVTLGCAKNEVDTEHMRARATGAGYALTDDPETADAIVVNTCSFIQAATEESLEAIFEAADLPNVRDGEAVPHSSWPAACRRATARISRPS